MKTNQKTALWLALLILLTFTFSSCEFDNNADHYVDIPKPQPPQVGIDISELNPEEVMQVPNGSYLYFSIDVEGKEIIEQVYLLDGVILGKVEQSSYASVFIDVPKVDDQIHDLTLVMSIRSGSGSIADMNKLEGFVGEQTFKVKVIDDAKQTLNIRQTTDAEGFLKLEWDAFKDAEVERYDIYESDFLSYEPLLSVNSSTLECVLKNYVYGNHKYKICPILKNSTAAVDHFANDYEVKYIEMKSSDFKFKRLPNNGIMEISWENPNPYPANYGVKRSWQEEDLVTDDSNKYQITDGGFPLDEYFSINIQPKEKWRSYDVSNDFSFKVQDQQLVEHSYGHYYDPVSNKLYSSTAEYLQVLDPSNNFELIKQNPNRGGNLIRTSQEGFIAIGGDNYSTSDVVVYVDDNLHETKLRLKDIRQFSFGGKYLLANYSKYVYVNDNWIYMHHLDIYEVASSQLVFSQKFEEDSYAQYQSYFSPNGKYFVLYDERTAHTSLYEWKNNQPELKREVTNLAMNAPIFNPANEEEIVYSFGNKFQVRDINTHQIKLEKEGVFFCIDPRVGNIMYSNDEGQTATILDAQGNRDLVQIKLNYVYVSAPPKLCNNMFLYGNYFVDYRNFIKK